MATIRLHCETLSPMFLAGASATPELRTPSFKGLLRFWWRALRPDLCAGDGKKGYEKMSKKEGELFGSGGMAACRSPLRLWIPKESARVQYGKERLLPHREGQGFPFRCLKGSFQLVMEFPEKKLEFYRDLALVALYLGGVGKRSRRGFGALNVEAETPDGKRHRIESLDQLAYRIATISTGYHKRSETIELREDRLPKESRGAIPYPYLERIRLGDAGIVDELLKSIGQASHDNVGVGYVNPNRLASPLYLSLVPAEQAGNARIIISELAAAYEGSGQLESKMHSFAQAVGGT